MAQKNGLPVLEIKMRPPTSFTRAQLNLAPDLVKMDAETSNNRAVHETTEPSAQLDPPTTGNRSSGSDF